MSTAMTSWHHDWLPKSRHNDEDHVCIVKYGNTWRHEKNVGTWPAWQVSSKIRQVTWSMPNIPSLAYVTRVIALQKTSSDNWRHQSSTCPHFTLKVVHGWNQQLHSCCRRFVWHFCRLKSWPTKSTTKTTSNWGPHGIYHSKIMKNYSTQYTFYALK